MKPIFPDVPVGRLSHRPSSSKYLGDMSITRCGLHLVPPMLAHDWAVDGDVTCPRCLAYSVVDAENALRERGLEDVL